MQFIITDDEKKVNEIDECPIDYNKIPDTDIVDQIIGQLCKISEKESTIINLRGHSEETDISFVVNSIADCYEEEDKIFNIDTIYLLVDNLSDAVIDKLTVNLHKPILQTVNHLFGDRGDPLKERFEEFNSQLRGTKFKDYLITLIDEKGYEKYSEVYKTAGISKYTFSKILNFSKDHKPSKDTVAALTIGLKLSLEDAQKFYHCAGYHLGTEDLVDKVIRFFISESLYDIDEVNYCLYYYKHPILGEKPRDSVKFEID